MSASTPASTPVKNWDVSPALKRQFDSIQDQVLRAAGDPNISRVLVVTSCHGREGRTCVAANVAAALASPPERQVAVVDATLAHPGLHKVFNLGAKPAGLSDYLASSKEGEPSLLSSPVPGLDVFPAGTKPADLADPDVWARMEQCLVALKERYRFVVVDAPPLSEGQLPVRLGAAADGVILVVQAHGVRWEVAQRAKDQLLQANANILGVVLNKRTFPIPGWLYRKM